jgi:hypothetical protein
MNVLPDQKMDATLSTPAVAPRPSRDLTRLSDASIF